MDWQRLQDVLVVCVPVFMMIAVGKLLERRGILNAEHRNFANWLTYNLALPALIFTAVAKQRVSNLINIPLLAGPLIAIALLTVLFIVLARLFKLRGSLAAAFVFGTFWANVSYMGFPLARNAFGENGMRNAAIYNAFIMPTFVVLAFVLIGFYGGETKGGFADKIRRAFVNPIVLAAVAGIVVAFAGEIFRNEDGVFQAPALLASGLEMTGSFLNLLGAMGLPLALLAVGGSMHLTEIRKRFGLLVLVLIGKLILLPLATLLVIRLFFPATDPVTLAVAVTLSATPNAVASFVVSRQIGVEEGFVSSMLVISTALSVLSLPVWLYLVFY